MILYEKKRIDLLQTNVIELEVFNDAANDVDGYVYVSFHTYNQALLISDRFEGEMTLIRKSVGSAEQEEAVQYFYEQAPEPINILAPFLSLADSRVKLPIEMRALCGVLHQMSMAIDFNMFLKVNPDIRADTVFSKSTIFGYERAWEDVKMKLNLSEVNEASISKDFLMGIIKEVLGAVRTENNPAWNGSASQGYGTEAAREPDFSKSVDKEDAIGEEYDMSLKAGDPGFDPVKFTEKLAEQIFGDGDSGSSDSELNKESETEPENPESNKEEEPAEERKLSLEEQIAMMYGGKVKETK